jgi:putative transport protein
MVFQILGEGVDETASQRARRLDPGFSAGLLSGSLTESSAIGTASEGITRCPCTRRSGAG